jgi:D-alanyl-D-alanine carboxypeptidase
MRRPVTLSLVALLVAAPLLAQSEARLDSLVNAQMAARGIPGVAVAVLRGGRPVAVKAWGLSILEPRTPATVTTAWGIASVSKQFIATDVMLLVQEGRLSLDDEIGKYLPEAATAWKGVTLRRLLSHTSGIQRESRAFDGSKVQPDSVVVAAGLAQPFDFAIGAKYQYCNLCYFAAAEMVRRVSGTSWESFTQERIFRPLGMTSSTTTNAPVAERATSYYVRAAGVTKAEEYAALRPSGAFVSSITDLARWEGALWTDRPLTRASRVEMATRVPLTDGTTAAYGLGWALDSLDGHPRQHHGGSLAGFRSEYARFPADSLAVIVLTNADVGRPAEIAEGVARLYFRR